MAVISIEGVFIIRNYFALWAVVLTALLLSRSNLLAAPSYITFPSDVDWVTKSSAHFDVLFRRGNDPLAERALRAAENAHRLLTPIFPESPERAYIVLADFQDSTNGYGITFPYPHMVIFAAPPEAAGQLASLDDWLNSVILHEYVHILHLFPAHGLWSPLRTIFGTIITPNGLMPSHFHEGLAVLLETEKTAGGRGRGTTFSMYKRVAVDSKVWGTSDFLSTDRMDGELHIYPEGASAYFFGYEMYRELWNRKGPKGIHDLVLSYSSNWPYLLTPPLREVYGSDFATLWRDVYRKTTEEEKKKIEDLKREPLSDLRYLTNSHFSKNDVAFSPDGKKVAFRKWVPEEGPGIDILSADKFRRIRSYETSGGNAEGLCWGGGAGVEWILYVDTEGADNYSINVIRGIDLRSEKTRRFRIDRGTLSHVQRLGCDSSLKRLLVYQEMAGRGVVRELEWNPAEVSDDPVLHVKREWPLPTGSWVSSLLPTGSSSWIGLRRGLYTEFYRWDGATPQNVLTQKGHYYSFREGKDGNEIYAIGDADGRDEVWSLDFAREESVKKVALLGGANSFDVNADTLILSSYRQGGYDLAVASPLESKSAKSARRRSHSRRTARAVNDDHDLASLPDVPMSATKEYSPLGTLLPKAWVPNFLFVQNGFQVGAWIPGFDLSQKHFYNIIGGYDSRGTPFGDVNYTYRFGRGSSVNSEAYYLPSYFSPTRTFIKQWGGTLGLGTSIKGFPFSVQVGPVFKRVEDVPDLNFKANQSVGAQITLSKGFGFKRHPVSISPLSGTLFTLSHSQYFKLFDSTDNYFSTFAQVDQYLEAPWWNEHVLFFSAKMGYTEGTVFFNNYFMAGGEILFAQVRGTFLNRGFLPQTFFGRRVFNGNVEYRFPIARIERGIGYVPLNLKSIHAALVADTTTYDFGPQSTLPQDLFRIFYVSTGVELKTDWTVGFYLPAQLRIGAYHGFGEYGETIYSTVGIEASL